MIAYIIDMDTSSGIRDRDRGLYDYLTEHTDDILEYYNTFYVGKESVPPCDCGQIPLDIAINVTGLTGMFSLSLVKDEEYLT